MVASRSVQTSGASLAVTDLPEILGGLLERLPHVLRLLAENHLRCGGDADELRQALEQKLRGEDTGFELMYRPNRLLMHDTTCTPALADIAGLRDALAEAGADPSVLAPSLPVEVSVDHSLAVDVFARAGAPQVNLRNEIARNAERYSFMKWASEVMETVHVNPPGTGIMHTLNLEQYATLLEIGTDGRAHPDMMLGTDSHTPMINGIGVLGWGIGGLEAESVMFGQTVSLAMPEVIGVRLDGRLPEGVTSTDLALELTHRLRVLDVTAAYVEFYGPGVTTLSADDRAVIANMAPEYGATTGFFPADANSVSYLKRTGRPEALTAAIEPAFRAMGLWFDPEAAPHFDRQIALDLGTLEPTLAGPRRPQDSLPARAAREAVETAVGRDLPALAERPAELPDGGIGVAAITSCTNTSDPRLLIAAGLLACKAQERGLSPAPWVKTSLAPGSPSATSYLARAGLLSGLEAVGFGIVGFGCTTCIGNSGPLPEAVEDALAEGKAVAAVLSGNRNFPGRVHAKLDLGFLASPPMVVAFALLGHLRADITRDPLGHDASGAPVYLSDLWPRAEEIESAMERAFRAEDVHADFREALDNRDWAALPAPATNRFPWDPESRNLRRPKFARAASTTALGALKARPLLVLGDDMTTDHISPAGWIDPESAAGTWLIERGGDPKNLNVYASYRGNWEVMLRGLFTNRSAINHLNPDLPPAHLRGETGEVLKLHEAAERFEDEGTPVVIFAGERYGMGSSRDWAAKGAALLGVRAVIARSFERIHRTNLIGMGILPIEITDGFIPSEGGLQLADEVSLCVEAGGLQPRQKTEVVVTRGDLVRRIEGRVAVETEQEIETLRAGGVLPKILAEQLSRTGDSLSA
ncbi:aconitate hydratase AcnA [Alloyangia pacifica]|uniref:Aconitate hydratase A n=1 Tax=Alloyangia pacifica TaxID=311180 RepID=A0A1I6WD80_9RHOB|nr:aconitate hydratase AcnA [Alloyangia pacifica]SDI60013.1 aconitate hydratase [Alloyangia pacifica]SFT23956.1 aconitate hydratase [Alloyangia pacifica]